MTDYTGIVAFYNYKETNQEKMLKQPYFFYYEKGKLQDEKELFLSEDRYLSMSQAPQLEAALSADDDTEQLVYVAQEVYVEPEAQSHADYLFAFNQKGTDNGLYTGSRDGVDYVDGLPGVEGEELPANNQVPAVELTGLTQDETSGGKPTLAWTKLDGVKSYEVYRRIGESGEWSLLGTTEPAVTAYTDETATQVGTTYFYRVRAAYEDGTFSGDGTSVLSYTCRAIPAVTVAALDKVTDACGMQVSWSVDTAAAGYRVLRKASTSQDWTAVKDFTAQELKELTDNGKVTWTDESAVSNTTYSYAVRAYYGEKTGADREAYSSNVWSGMTASNAVYYLAAPTMTDVYSNSTGMTLKWSKVEGATGYLVYRKPATGGGWTRIGQTAANVLTLTDKTVSGDASYFYTVRAIRDKTMGPYFDHSDDKGTAVTFHGIPTVSIANGSKFVVSWTQNASATGYRVFRQEVGTGRWVTVANITSGKTITYTETTAKSGVSYQYTVRAYYGDAANLAKDSNYNSNLWSGYKASATVLYVAAPELGDTYSDAGGMRTTWTPVANAVGYILYRRSAGTTSFTNLGRINDGKASYYVDKTAKVGTAYSYTVKAICKDSSGKEHTSGFYYPETNETYHATPTVTVAASAAGNVIYWTLDSKAVGYRLYRQVGSGKMVVLKNLAADEVTVNSSGQGRYADDKLTSGTKYAYAVRAYYGTGDLNKVGVDTSNDWSGGKTVAMTFLSAPKMSMTSDNTTTGVKIGWGKVTGAAGYEIYRKPGSGGSWSLVGKVSNGATEVYVDTKTANGASYYYTVRAIDASGNRSSYDSIGVYSTRLPAPVLDTVLVGSSGTTIKWKAVSNATGYQVYRKKAGGTWQRLTTTTNASVLSYVDTSVKNRDVVYYYTVKAYRSGTVSGRKVTIYGAYDTTGITFSIPMSGSGWVKKNGNTYYVKNGYCLIGWQYLSRNGDTYKYYFDTETGALVTNLYSYFGKSYRNLNCRIVTCINTNDSNPSYNTIYLYDSETKSYCIPAVSVRCVGNVTKTTYQTSNKSKTAYLRAGTGQRWLDSGSYEQYATYISGTYSWFHSALYFGSKSPYSFSSASYNSMVNNNNSSNGCVRMQCIYAFLIQDIMKYGYGKSNRVSVILKKNTSQPGPFGVPKVDKISSRKSDPTDPAVTGKFFYDTSMYGISAKAGASAWTYY